MADYDIIIVGAGLAGLTAGAKLAIEGRKILLIEQHSKMGGCATTFRRNVEALNGAKVTFEVGLHEMDGLANENNPKNRIFKEFNIFDKVEFIQVPEFYRFTNGRVDVVIPHNIPEAIKVLVEEFSDEKEGINKFYYDIEQIYLNYVQGNLMALVDFSQLSIGEYLDTITSNEDLKFVLIANLGYYGDDPYTLAMIPFSI
jgi:phytoene dehydrogenase-like protein